MTWTDFNLLTQRRDSSRDTGKPSMPFVVRDQNPAWNDPESTLVMDSKGLYDSLDNELPQDDKKSALEVPIIVEFLKRIGGRARWVPHNKNPGDAMTKFKGAHMLPLLQLLKTGFYEMRGEREELESRAQQKQTGTVRRNKTSAKRFNQQSSPASKAQVDPDEDL